mmetsp:Transcript_5290/g.13161  ORF Transcript_5290/g.13161 Transcript_5290/m.13161 type:complete len:294 (+) Transcript_5290:158-1039(+)
MSTLGATSTPAPAMADTDTYERLLGGVYESWSKVADVCAIADHGAGIAILDVGSGPGEPACQLKKVFPQAEVTSTDLEADMVGKAKKRAERLGVQLKFAVCGAENLSPFPDASFDVVTANFVLMFPQNKCRMLEEAMRVLKPGGRLIATVWKSFDLTELSDEALKRALGEALPGPTGSHPLALRAPGAVEELVKEAGLHLASSEQCTLTMRWGCDEETARSNFLFVGRRGLQSMAGAERIQAEIEFLRYMAEETAKRCLRKADGSYEFHGEYQIVAITRSQEEASKRRKLSDT